MKKLNDNDLFLCRYLSDLFEYATLKNECCPHCFYRAYIHSSVRKRMCSRNFINESLDIPAAYEIIKKESSFYVNLDGSNYPSYVMAWIGYIFKYMSIALSIPEITLYKSLKISDLYKQYESYHSLDNDLVVERLVESNKINTNRNDLKLLKKIYNIM